ncbi:phosphohistidine phosphatase SixA [Marinobacterium nitratireducens]|uniref:Phosphohistidine phosphatase SixA n=1 Tax=Marinobacterium nitratireducens TaxID=518897 RepID=A0A918DP57_9GAMM|nr:phosphohistidine phosphatase SixA [Marinobacterium nitratireducens]GGO75891.1 phosphohistidine phosphatase SixA [Marinobacterium nitratireducens]
MKLYLMRHGEAGFNAASDFERSLTEAGVAALDRLLEREHETLRDIRLIVSSPYLRARQTAQRLAAHLGAVQLDPVGAFTPESEVTTALAALETCATDGLLLVAHQPLLGKLVATLCDGDARYPEPMLPGSIAILELDWPAAGLGVLVKKLDCF